MSNEEFIQSLVSRLNVQLDLPFVGEAFEAQMLDWVVRKIVPMIPDSIREFVLTAADGIDEQELDRLEDVLVSVLNHHIDIPWVPEQLEPGLFRPVVQAVLSYAQLGLSLDTDTAV